MPRKWKMPMQLLSPSTKRCSYRLLLASIPMALPSPIHIFARTGWRNTILSSLSNSTTRWSISSPNGRMMPFLRKPHQMIQKKPQLWSFVGKTLRDTTASGFLRLRRPKLSTGPQRWFSSTRKLGALSATCSTSLTSSKRLIAGKAIWRWRRCWRIVRQRSTAPRMSCVDFSSLTALSATGSIQMCRQGKGWRSPSCHPSSAIAFRWISLIWGQWGSGTFMVRCSAGSWPWKTIRLV